MIRHLANMHGWTDEDLYKVMTDVLGRVLQATEIISLPTMLERLHQMEHGGEYGEFNDLAHPERRHAQFHAH